MDGIVIISIAFQMFWTAFIALGFYRMGKRHGRESANYGKLEY